MTEEAKLQELHASDWYKELPEKVKVAVDQYPPIKFYRFKDSKKQFYIFSFEEPENEDGEITITVQKIGIGGAMAEMGMGPLDTNMVFGVSLKDIEDVTYGDA